jgi:tRNA(adenine34) deaminase
VPIRAVVVDAGRELAAACNAREALGDPRRTPRSSHAAGAAAVHGEWRLSGCTLAVTV